MLQNVNTLPPIHACKHTVHTPAPARDLPQGLQVKEGGFLASNATAFQDAFVYYANVMFRELGPLVKLWMT